MHKARPLEERFWNLVAIADELACWPWKGLKHIHSGYGMYKEGQPRKTVTTHRLAWRLTYGAIPAGLLVCHKCDNRVCCNPKHLFLGTHKDNSMDASAKGRLVNRHKRITDAHVTEVRLLASNGELHRVIARRFGVSKTLIGFIVNHKRRTVLQLKH